MQLGWIEKSPFKSYLIPRFLLLLMNGIFPLPALYGLITKNLIVALLPCVMRYYTVSKA